MDWNLPLGRPSLRHGKVTHNRELPMTQRGPAEEAGFGNGQEKFSLC
jgi:hypothetical protein